MPQQLLLLEDVLLLRAHQAGLVAVDELLLQRATREKMRVLVLDQIGQLLQLFLEDEECRGDSACLGLTLQLLLYCGVVLLLGTALGDLLLVDLIVVVVVRGATAVAFRRLAFGGFG